ncbi:MAG: Holliday junction branch migration protein RuvA [Patescibacteria group bacterium]|nr:Holliday junction branch migration protein RuvA [Patescibacteria group bacterium]
MIGRITGQVQDKGSDWVLIGTSGGVGYKVYATHDLLTKAQIGDDLTLSTHLVVREDVLALYGFEDQPTVEFFKALIGISGVGPRSALGILNAGKVDDLKSAINDSNVALFTTISGIGRKTAERIIIDLKNKLDGFSGNASKDTEELLTALSALGYNTYEVKAVLPQIPRDLADTEDRVKHALKLLGK